MSSQRLLHKKVSNAFLLVEIKKEEPEDFHLFFTDLQGIHESSPL